MKYEVIKYAALAVGAFIGATAAKYVQYKLVK